MPLSDCAVPGWLPGWEVRYADAAPSTNALAADAVRRGADGPGPVRPTAYVVDHQTAGRGRLDRDWQTPAGVALTVSAVLDPGLPDDQWPWLPLVTGVCVCGAVATVTGGDVTPVLKWPNDVLVRGGGEPRKLAGILVERVPGPTGPRAVIGVGLNVHQSADQIPVATGTSLAMLSAPGTLVARVDLLRALLASLGTTLAEWSARGEIGPLAADYASRCITLGQQVRVHLPGAPGEIRLLEGQATGLDHAGRLVVTDDAGVEHPVGAGDVVHVRTA